MIKAMAEPTGSAFLWADAGIPPVAGSKFATHCAYQSAARGK